MASKFKSLPAYLLMLLVLILALSALYGGFALITDPSGEKMHLPLNLLADTPFVNYSLPGTVLFLLLGVIPFLLIFPLMSKTQNPEFGFLNIYKGYHWAWTYTLYISIILIVFIDIQMIIIRKELLLQNFFGFYGVVMLIVVLLPAVKRVYRIEQHKSLHKKNKIPEFK